MRMPRGVEAERRARVKAQQSVKEREEALDHLAAHPNATYNVPTAVYKSILLHKDGWIMSRGEMYNVRGKSLGAGVYELRLELRHPK